jgi:hypothetical protein
VRAPDSFFESDGPPSVVEWPGDLSPPTPDSDISCDSVACIIKALLPTLPVVPTGVTGPAILEESQPIKNRNLSRL